MLVRVVGFTGRRSEERRPDRAGFGSERPAKWTCALKADNIGTCRRWGRKRSQLSVWAPGRQVLFSDSDSVGFQHRLHPSFPPSHPASRPDIVTAYRRFVETSSPHEALEEETNPSLSR